MKIFRKLLVNLMLVMSLAMPTLTLATAGTVYAADCADPTTCTQTCNDSKSCAQAGVCQVDQNGCKTDSNKSVSSIVGTVIDLLSLAVGVAAVIMIIVGGFKYVISSGDSANVTSAKNTILYAIVGLIIVALAQIIVKFVIAKTPTTDPTKQTSLRVYT